MAAAAKFFVLTYALAWAFFIPAVVTGKQAIFLPGVFAPAIATIALTYRSDGAAGVRALLSRVVQWRVSWRWYAFAVLYMLTIKLAAAVVHRAAIGAWPRFGTTPWVVMLIAVLLSAPVQAGEEIGWRGFALPRLAQRLGYANASLIVGVVWAVWHLPQFYLAGADTYGQSFPRFTLQVIALSVAMAFLYMRTGGSLLLTMLMHAAINNTKDVVPSVVPAVGWITVALLWTGAAYFYVRMRYADRVTASIVTSSPGGVSPMNALT